MYWLIISCFIRLGHKMNSFFQSQITTKFPVIPCTESPTKTTNQTIKKDNYQIYVIQSIVTDIQSTVIIYTHYTRAVVKMDTMRLGRDASFVTARGVVIIALL